MAWTTPRTWVASEVVTAALLNTHLRDNLNYLYAAPGFRLRKAADTANLTTSTFTAVPLDTEDYDTDGLHDTVTNNTRVTFTAATAGVWHVTGQASWVGNATGERIITVRVNGTNFVAYVRASAASANAFVHHCDTLYRFANGDYIELVGWQSSGAGLAINGGVPYSPVLVGRWVSA